MFLWFKKRFMKQSYKKYLEDLNSVNCLKMDIIEQYNSGKKYTKKAYINQYNFHQKTLNKIIFYKDGITKDLITELEQVFVIVFKEIKCMEFPYYYITDYNNYNIFYNGKVIPNKFKKEIFKFIKVFIFEDIKPSNWITLCDGFKYV